MPTLYYLPLGISLVNENYSHDAIEESNNSSHGLVYVLYNT